MDVYLTHQQRLVEYHGQHHFHRKRTDILHSNGHFDQLIRHIQAVLTTERKLLDHFQQ